VTGRTWWLTRRLGWRLALVLLVAIGLAAGAVGWRAIVTARALDDIALQAQVAAIVAALTTGSDGGPRLDLPPDLAAAFQRPNSASVFLVTDAAGKTLLASDPVTAALIVPYLPGPGLFRVPPLPRLPQGMLGYAARAGPWRVAVSQSREQSEALVGSLMTEFFSTGLALLAAICAASVLIGVLTVRQGLRPLRLASGAAVRVDPARPGLRLPETGLPGEVAPLVAAVNQALARLEAALGAQRRFVGDAAHTLRTPLAVLTARLDSLPDEPVTTALRGDADRMTRLIEQMLQMARLDGMPLDVSQPVDLRAVAVEAISALAPLAVRRGAELALSEPAPVAPLRGNRAAPVIALTNLIENALAHAPAGSLVEVVVAPPARISVLDRGPGVSVADRRVIFERFGRGHAAGTAGAGLGLAIVAGIAVAHRGSVQVVARDGGGGAFELELGTLG
jgi:signal transduction histidine kinase